MDQQQRKRARGRITQMQFPTQEGEPGDVSFAPGMGVDVQADFTGSTTTAMLMRHAELAVAYDRMTDLYQASAQYMLVFNTLLVINQLNPAMLTPNLLSKLASVLAIPVTSASVHVSEVASYIGRHIATLHDALVSFRCAEAANASSASGADDTPCPSPLLVKPTDCVTFQDIIGQSEAKRQLREGLIMPMRYPKMYSKLSRGVLMYGPPGTGKTEIVRAALNSLVEDPSVQIIFYTPTGSELKGKYVGESEKKIKKLFQCASARACECNFSLRVDDQILHNKQLMVVTAVDEEQVTLKAVDEEEVRLKAKDKPDSTVTVTRASLKQPTKCDIDPESCDLPVKRHYDSSVTVISVIFIDEVDQVARSRETAGGETATLSLIPLLQAMDGVESAPNVVVIAATNRPYDLDSAFKRRVPVKIYMSLPSKSDIENFINLTISKEVMRKLTGSTSHAQILRYCGGQRDDAMVGGCGLPACESTAIDPTLWRSHFAEQVALKSNDVANAAEALFSGRYSFAEVSEVMKLAFSSAARRALEQLLFVLQVIDMPNGTQLKYWGPPTASVQENGGDVMEWIRDGKAYVATDSVPGSTVIWVELNRESYLRSELTNFGKRLEEFKQKYLSAKPYTDYASATECFVSTKKSDPLHGLLRGKIALSQKKLDKMEITLDAVEKLKKLMLIDDPHFKWLPHSERESATSYFNTQVLSLLGGARFDELTYPEIIKRMTKGKAENIPVAKDVLKSVYAEGMIVYATVYVEFNAPYSYFQRLNIKGAPRVANIYTDWGMETDLVKLPPKGVDELFTKPLTGHTVFDFPIATPSIVPAEIHDMEEFGKQTNQTRAWSVAQRRREVQQNLTSFALNYSDFLFGMKLVVPSADEDEIQKLDAWGKDQGSYGSLAPKSGLTYTPWD